MRKFYFLGASEGGQGSQGSIIIKRPTRSSNGQVLTGIEVNITSDSITTTVVTNENGYYTAKASEYPIVVTINGVVGHLPYEYVINSEAALEGEDILQAL